LTAIKINFKDLNLDKELMVEMANLNPLKTGILKGWIYISTEEGQHGPRVKFKGNLKDASTWFSLSIEKEPKIIAGKTEITSSKNLKKIKEFIELNYKTLLNFWYKGQSMDDDEVERMKKNFKKPE